MIILVGGTGFIGKHLCQRLDREQAAGVVVSRAPDEQFLKNHASSVTSMTLTDFEGSAGEVILQRASALVYLATRSVPATSGNTPWSELSLNVEPAFRIFDRVARTNPLARLVFISSGGTVYGAQQTTPISENEALAPISGYGLGKMLTEQCLQFLGRTRSVPTRILRLSNPVGRWQMGAEQGLVPIAMRAVSQGRPVPIFGDGGQVRDYVSVDEVADAILRACRDQSLGERVWNVGSGVGRTIMGLVGMIESVVGRRAMLDYQPRRTVDVPFAVLDCSRIRRDLGWVGSADISAALQEVWAATQERLAAESPLTGLPA